MLMEVSDRLEALAGVFEKYAETGGVVSADDVRLTIQTLRETAEMSRANETMAESYLTLAGVVRPKAAAGGERLAAVRAADVDVIDLQQARDTINAVIRGSAAFVRRKLAEAPAPARGEIVQVPILGRIS